LLQSRGQNPLGHDQQLRIAGEVTLESDLPSNFTSKCPSAFFRNAPGDCPRGNAARLQQNHPAGVDERRWNSCGFTRSRRGGNDDGAAAFEVITNARDVRVDAQRAQRAQRCQRG